MVPLRRLPEPEILVEKKAAWLKKYLERRAQNPRERPSSSQYAHREIVEALAAMSHWKCFYCGERLDYLRSKQLRLFMKTHQELTERRCTEGGRPLNEREREILRGFRDPSQPFSLMFTEYLAAIGL